MPAPILRLTTLEPERPLVEIDREPDGTQLPAGGFRFYELAVLGDFGVEEQARLSRLIDDVKKLEPELEAKRSANAPAIAEVNARIAAGKAADPAFDDTALTAELFQLQAMSEAEAARMATILDEVVDTILRAPAPVRESLREPHQLALIASFSTAVLGMAAPTTTPSQPKSSTSGSSSRSSRRSTARGRG
jgi:hypothetical protein